MYVMGKNGPVVYNISSHFLMKQTDLQALEDNWYSSHRDHWHFNCSTSDCFVIQNTCLDIFISLINQRIHETNDLKKKKSLKIDVANKNRSDFTVGPTIKSQRTSVNSCERWYKLWIDNTSLLSQFIEPVRSNSTFITLIQESKQCVISQNQ